MGSSQGLTPPFPETPDLRIARERLDDRLDDALDDTFPASDPVASPSSGIATVGSHRLASKPRAETVAADTCEALGARGARVESYPTRELSLGSLVVSRALPIKERRLVGPWCFLDRFGPLSFSTGRPMDVAPHPHIGLQTVTWLLDGEVVHDDSLGHESILRPGGVHVMTSGSGIAHAEQTPTDNTGRLNGVQLWVALPDSRRHMAATFEHVAEVPTIESRAGRVQVFAGTLQGEASPAVHFSEILGVDLQVHAGHTLTLPLQATFEHAVLVLSGDVALDGQSLQAQVLHYLGTTRSEASLSSRNGGRLLLVGGPPFPETILMWWNFVARSRDEIAQARADWETGERFGNVVAYKGPRLSAPSLVRVARPNPVS
jgi:redox-sensitive bicupin YhaK (pirin superfamily)